MKDNKKGTKMCPACGKVFMNTSYLKEGIGKFTTRCPHCQAYVLTEFANKVIVSLTILSILIIMGIVIPKFIYKLTHPVEYTTEQQ